MRLEESETIIIKDQISEENEYIAEKSLWNPKHFFVMSLFFSYIPISIFYILNFNRMRESKKRNRAIVIIIGATILLVVGILLIDNELIGKIFVLTVAYTLAYYMKSSQINLYKKQIENGAKKATYLLPILLALAFSGLLIYIIIYINRLTESMPTNYINFYDDTIYYSETISDEELELLSDYFTNYELFSDDDNPIDIMIVQIDDVYTLSLFFLEEVVDNPDVILELKYLREDLLSTVLTNGRDVKINLCDEKLNVLKSIEG